VETLKGEKKIWKAVRPAWKPEISDLLLEEKSESRSMEKESQPRSMKKKSKSRSMEKESKRQPMKKESKSQSADEISKLGWAPSHHYSLPFEEVIQFARGSVGPDLSMGPSPSPPLVTSL